ncbi:hypothetical protein ABW19_dt0206003 [Dactylella cylindrospora]|nr:hypothetical protein ABW19_dt0206003 [Dactylella cylindrospora]
MSSPTLPAPPTTASASLRALLTSYSDLNHPSNQIEYLEHPPSPLEFLRIISRNRPVVIKNAMSDWPATGAEDGRKWSVDYLKAKMGDAEVMVAETPKGNADSIVEQDGVEYFVKPHTSHLPFTPFLTTLTSTTTSPTPPRTILYAQSQDSNLTSEYTSLASDIPSTIPWASIALDQPLPDATNLWIGNQWSVSSLHKDPYQNLYGVVLGTKIFTLINPLGTVAVQEKKVRSATYTKSAPDTFAITPDPAGGSDDGYITWPSVDLEAYFALSEGERNVAVEDIAEDDPLKWIKLVQPIRVEVKPGEMLYLPAMWYHQVAQKVDEKEGVCVAVNYWYDMDFSGPFVSGLNYVRDMTALLLKYEQDEEERRAKNDIIVKSPVNAKWCSKDCDYDWVQK